MGDGFCLMVSLAGKVEFNSASLDRWIWIIVVKRRMTREAYTGDGEMERWRDALTLSIQLNQSTIKTPTMNDFNDIH